jgi:F-type H+-transporting ATPase subunit epsilon
MAEIQLNIVTPEKTVYSGSVLRVRAPGSEGGFGVLPGHTPLLAALSIGEISFVEADSTAVRLTASGGFAEVQPERVTILAESAERIEEIDTSRAIAARDRALARIEQKKDTDMVRAQAALSRAVNRIKVSGNGN